MVKMNDYGSINAPEFPNGEKESKEKFIELILKNAPKFSAFCIHEIANKLDLSELEKKQFNYLKYEIRSDLDKSGLTKFPIKGNSDIILTEGGRNYFELKHPNTILADAYFGGDINGIYLSRSQLENPLIKKTKAIPIKNPEKKLRLITIFSNPWLIGFVLTAITVLCNSKRVMDFINKLVNQL